MFTVAIDGNKLNGLFDNQKKLDDLFDSIFDDDNYFISSVSPSSSAESRNSSYDLDRQRSPKPSRVTESLLMIKHQCPYFFLLPIVLEIVAIYWAVTNLL